MVKMALALAVCASFGCGAAIDTKEGPSESGQSPTGEEGSGGEGTGTGTSTTDGSSGSESGLESSTDEGGGSETGTDDGDTPVEECGKEGPWEELDWGGAGCEDVLPALTAAVTEPGGGCSVVVRLDHDTYELEGFAVACGAIEPSCLTANETRALSPFCEFGEWLTPPDVNDVIVCHVEPSDLGGVAMVSNHLQALAFEGSIVFDGSGDIEFPDEWSPPAELGSGCTPAELPEPVVYDALSDQEDSPLPADAVSLVTEAIATTALPAALGSAGPIRRFVILRYPRSVGAFNPESAEYIVLLESAA